MIQPSHPALQSRDVGPVSAANRPKPALQQARDGQDRHQSLASRPENRRAFTAQSHGAAVQGIDGPRPEPQFP